MQGRRLDLQESLDLNDACIWWCSIDELGVLDLDRLMSELRYEVLGDEEFERISRYRVLDDRKRSLLSVLLMKLALTNYYDISPKEVKIVREKGMKPYFKYSRENARQIHFNVSHDGDIVVIILSKRVVGIDVMKSELPLRSRSSGSSVEEAKEKFLNNMKNIFQPSEWNYIQRDISRFMRYWTIKESFVKYVGLGLYIDPKRLLIDLNDTVEDNCNTLNSLSLEKASIYMDNQIQKCEIYSSNQIIPNYYISFCVSESHLQKSTSVPFSSSRDYDNASTKKYEIKIQIRRLGNIDFSPLCFSKDTFAALSAQSFGEHVKVEKEISGNSNLLLSNPNYLI